MGRKAALDTTIDLLIAYTVILAVTDVILAPQTPGLLRKLADKLDGGETATVTAPGKEVDWNANGATEQESVRTSDTASG